VVAAAGAALTAAYFLRLLRRVSHGPAVALAGAPGLTRVELVAWAPLIGLALGIGLAPVLVLGMAYDPVAALAAVIG
jgi:NADH-quinone oxidoreductase subunit M